VLVALLGAFDQHLIQFAVRHISLLLIDYLEVYVTASSGTWSRLPEKSSLR
jgi:hypothetical protein